MNFIDFDCYQDYKVGALMKTADLPTGVAFS